MQTETSSNQGSDLRLPTKNKRAAPGKAQQRGSKTRPPLAAPTAADFKNCVVSSGLNLNAVTCPFMNRQVHQFLAPRQAAVTVLARRQAIVIGPTPPGTGVIALATSFASAKHTSPTNFVLPLSAFNAVDPNIDNRGTLA